MSNDDNFKPIPWKHPHLSELTRALLPGSITLIGGDGCSDHKRFLFENIVHWKKENIPATSYMTVIPEAAEFWVQDMQEKECVLVLNDILWHCNHAALHKIATACKHADHRLIAFGMRTDTPQEFLCQGPGTLMRLASTVLWMESLSEHTPVPVTRERCTVPDDEAVTDFTQCNRKLHILKSRYGHGHNRQIAYHYNEEDNSFTERGIVAAERI